MKRTAIVTIAFISPLFLLAQNVGIGTQAPKARLHVADSSVLFSGPATLSLTPGNPPVSGAGARMMWYADKAALRAGMVTGPASAYWDKDNIGMLSVAFGEGTAATGDFSFAMGTGSIASGLYASSFGLESKAAGWGSNAMGVRAAAFGEAATAFGLYTTARAVGAPAVGMSNDDSDNPDVMSPLPEDRIFQVGNGNKSNTLKKNALTVLRNGKVGIGTTSPGALLHINGTMQLQDGSQANNRVLTSDGNGLASWKDLPESASYWESAGIGIKYPGSISVGGNNIQSNTSLFVEGNVLIEAPLSTDMDGAVRGYPTIGPASYLFWYADKGAFSVGGFSATVNNADVGKHSVALGRDNLAVEANSIAAGFSSQARGFGSVALGNGLITRASGSIAVGTYNLPDNFDNRNFPSDKLFQVGNGSGEADRRNAMTILRSGNIGVGTPAPQALLHVKGESGEALRLQSSDPFIGFYDNAASYSGFLWANKLFGNDLRLGTPAASNMAVTLAPNGDATLVAAANGNIGIGAVSPAARLEVVAGPSATATKVVIGNRGGFGPAALEFVSDYGLINQWRPGYIASGDNGSFTGKLEFFTNGTGSGNLYGAVKGLEVRNGATLTATGSVGSFSDARLKNHVEPFTDGLNVIEHINPVQFQYNADAPFVTPDRQVGIVAQELEKVAPYMVHQTAEGNVKDMRWVDNQAYVFLLINAVKELTSRDEAYKAQLEVLEKRVKELDQRNLQQQQEIEKLKAKDHPKFSIK